MEEHLITVGIDPGKKGGITELLGEGFAPAMHPLPLAKDGSWCPKAMRELALTFKAHGAAVGIEKVHMFPGMSAAASSQVLMGYYLWIGVLTALKVPFMEIRAEDWRTEFDLKVKIEKAGPRATTAEKEAAYEARKAKAFAFACLTFGDHFTTPRGRKLDGYAEAAIIALYVKRKG
jgi:hypothetical protein